MNAISKIYESVLKIQNENKNENMSQIETAGRKQRSTVGNPLSYRNVLSRI